MARTCSECTYLNLDKEYDTSDGRFWCETKLEWHYANEAACYRYCTAYSRNSSVARSYKEHSEACQQSSGCFITTVIVNILKQNDRSIAMEKLRAFRDNILKKNDKYKKVLVEYDLIGPIVATKLSADSNALQISKNLYNLGIKNVIKLIDKGLFDEAVSLYADMTELLKIGYNIKTNITKEEIENCDLKASGHGNYVKKV